MTINKEEMNIDPRILLLFSFFYTIYIFIEQSLLNLATIFLFFFLIIAFRHFFLIKNLLILFIVSGAMIIGILYFIFYLDLFELSKIYLRITSISTLYSFFYAEIDPENLTKALIYFKIPYKYSWTIATSYRFVFFLVQESQEVKNALLLRGVPLDGNLLDKIRTLPIIISQLIYRTNYLSMKFSEALFAKNWSPYGKKTWYKPLNVFDSFKTSLVITCLTIFLLLIPFLTV